MEKARLELPATPAAAGVARLFVRCLCEEWGVEDVADVAELLSSELVTNAVIHAHSAVELCAVRMDGGDLRVDVFDNGTLADGAPDPARITLNGDAPDRPEAAAESRSTTRSSTQTVAALPATSDAESGRGLAIVASLATRWGVDADGHGKSVWFTLSTLP
jgi:anti-sigma regulatory factor (Ser/Thr protein kinase)